MKKIIVLAAVAASLATSAFAESKDHVYVGLGYGKNLSTTTKFTNENETDAAKKTTNTKSLKNGFAKLAVGYAFGDFRVEVEGLSYVGAKKESVLRTAGFVNAFYDISAVGNGFRPYVGGGVGLANFKIPADGNKKFSKTVFAYNLAAGVQYDINEQFYVDLGYKYLGFANIKTPSKADKKKGTRKVSAHLVMIGAGMKF